MTDSSSSSATLQRRIGLRSAVLFNMLEMIGVGPFITLPLVIAAAGYKLSVWAWVLGAAIAVADGLVWAELGAAFPRAGGSYAFLREIYGPDRAGNWLSFLYVWQLSFSAPLSIASGCIGLSSFLGYFWPGLEGAPIASFPSLHYSNFAAAAACLLVTALLYRNLSSITRLAWVLFAGVMAAITGVIVSGFAHAAATGGWHMPDAPALSAGIAIGGLAQATLITTYDYWGYYNITFLGSEVRRPEKTIPRAILLSVLFVSMFYVAMNLAALPSLRDAAAHAAANATVRLQLVAEIARSAFGHWAGYTIATLIVWTAFASVFSLQLGYSRVPYAAARDGNYFHFLAAVHPRHGIPHRSLVALGLVGAFFCFFSLADVITMLVVTRILLQFFLQQFGVMLLRIQRPELERPFRMPLYPLPPLAAMAGFVFILVNRAHALGGLAVAGGIGLSGTLIYLFRARRLGQWPFAQADRIVLTPMAAGRDEEFAEMLDEFRAAGELDVYSGSFAVAWDGYAGFYELLTRMKLGGYPTPEIVPMDSYFIEAHGQILGEIFIRHRMSEKLEKMGGHIGYKVRPSYRNKGVATAALKLGLQKLAAIGVEKALVTCNTTNGASARVIEKCGGVRIDDALLEGGRVERRFWVRTGK